MTTIKLNVPKRYQPLFHPSTINDNLLLPTVYRIMISESEDAHKFNFHSEHLESMVAIHNLLHHQDKQALDYCKKNIPYRIGRTKSKLKRISQDYDFDRLNKYLVSIRPELIADEICVDYSTNFETARGPIGSFW